MSSNEQPSLSVAVIGAGLAGLTAARGLVAAGHSVTVLDKGRGIGGRMATRRGPDGLQFDHGAQFFTARGAAFRELIVAQEAVDDWRPTVADDAVVVPSGWQVGVPAMNAFPKALARGLDIRTGVTVTRLHREQGRWHLDSLGDSLVGPVDRVVLAVPAPQAVALLHGVCDPIVERLDSVVMDPCWALLVGFGEPVALDTELISPMLSDLAWIADNGSKPGRGGFAGAALVIHASAEWSRTNLELTADQAAAALLVSLRDTVACDLPAPVYVAAHRWRFAKTRMPLGVSCLVSDDKTLFVGGDWCLGARVEYAFDSGRALAEAVGASASY